MSEASLIWRDVHMLLREKSKVQNNKYSRPSEAFPSALADSTNHRLKKKNPESSKSQNLSFPHASNYLQSITLYL